MRPVTPLMLVMLLGMLASLANAAGVIDLSGRWAFKLDPEGVGASQAWYDTALQGRIQLPGSVDTAHLSTHVMRPESRRLTRTWEYVGKAWYQREVTIPSGWRGKRIWLSLERCHWTSEVWVDSAHVGTFDSLCVPHQYDLSKYLTPGRHRITVCIDNTYRYNIGHWAHSITEETQTNWNGIIGRIELRAGDPLEVRVLEVTPEAEGNSFCEVKLLLANHSSEAGDVKWKIALTRAGETPGQGAYTAGVCALQPWGTRTEVCRVRLPRPLTNWDEFDPQLYEVIVQGVAGRSTLALKTPLHLKLGFRTLGESRHHFTLNGRQISLRGNVDSCVFPLTGYPPMDLTYWQGYFKKLKAYGMNHARFHSWCPPEAAFEAADEAGVLLQVEAPLWYTEPKDLDAGTKAFVDCEVHRILQTYKWHPSFFMLSFGNELGPSINEFLNSLYIKHNGSDEPGNFRPFLTQKTGFSPSRVLAATKAGWVRAQGVSGPARAGTEFDYSKALVDMQQPVVSHEIGQYEMYCDLAEQNKYTGHLKPLWLDAVRKRLKQHHLLQRAEAFRQASGQFIWRLYKSEIESLLRTRDSAGFQALGLNDFPGQGVALVGILDSFWASKGLITSSHWRQFCGPTVPLVRMEKRQWTLNETFTARAEVYHYGAGQIPQAAFHWQLRDCDERILAEGDFPKRDILASGLTELGNIQIPLEKLAAPQQLELSVFVPGTQIRNAWPVWVYPARQQVSITKHVYVSHAWDKATRQVLESGGRVLLMPLHNELEHTISARFMPVFWDINLFPQQPETMGLLCQKDSPLLVEFPTDEFANWQWYDLMNGAEALVLDGLPADVKPAVEFIDDFNFCHRLSGVVEAQVGKGRLVICTLNCQGEDFSSRPASAQLLQSLLDYLSSEELPPAPEVTFPQLDALLEPSPLKQLEAAPSAQQLKDAKLVVDAAPKVALGKPEPWKPQADVVQLQSPGFGYSVHGGTWRDAQGSAWFDGNLWLTITCPKGFKGKLFARFSDWNVNHRVAEVSFEGRKLGKLSRFEKGFWLGLPLTKQDTADGQVVLEARTLAGPNVMITKLVIVPED